MVRILLLISILSANACGTGAVARADVQNVFTRIDDMRTGTTIRICRPVSEAGEKDHPVLTWSCPPGPGGWPVEMFYADDRTQVSFGNLLDPGHGAIAALEGAFADPHHTIQWRLRNGRAYAAIHRYFFDKRQALTVHRLNADRTSCVAAVVAVERGRDANLEAARLADTVVPAFRCDQDKPVIVGRVAAPAE